MKKFLEDPNVVKVKDYIKGRYTSAKNYALELMDEPERLSVFMTKLVLLVICAAILNIMTGAILDTIAYGVLISDAYTRIVKFFDLNLLNEYPRKGK